MNTQDLWDSDQIVDQLISQHDDKSMPLPDIECQPHLLISKVRKHYMEYLIRLLAMNYETNQKLLNKNIYLPSAIWRCAKNIETAAAQMCMMAQLYRQNITAVVKELKNDTKKGKLNRKLYECLHTPPENEKKLQTTLNLAEDCTCECRCKYKKKRRKTSHSPINSQEVTTKWFPDIKNNTNLKITFEQNKIPVLINSQVENFTKNQNLDNFLPTVPNKVANLAAPSRDQPNNIDRDSVRMSVESQESDELMMQLEKLFQADPNDDDLFDGAYSLAKETDSFALEDTKMKTQNDHTDTCAGLVNMGSSIIESHSMQIKSLDERLASLAGLLSNNTETDSTPTKADTLKDKKSNCSKWLCEEFFLKSRLFELLDEIGDNNRKKLARIKESITQLFGDDSDDEGVVSPLEETSEFVTSCKERIAPWVVKLLTPYYIKGRIRGKALFKALAKHLIRLIYQCSHYPREYEVKSFISDFLENHKMIRCEADFKQFRIENL